MSQVIESGTPTQITASTQISQFPCSLLGIMVSAASTSPTIKVWNNTSASGAVLVDTFTPVAGTYYPMPAKCGPGLYVSISGTVSCTVFWNA